MIKVQMISAIPEIMQDLADSATPETMRDLADSAPPETMRARVDSATPEIMRDRAIRVIPEIMRDRADSAIPEEGGHKEAVSRVRICRESSLMQERQRTTLLRTELTSSIRAMRKQ